MRILHLFPKHRATELRPFIDALTARQQDGGAEVLVCCDPRGLAALLAPSAPDIVHGHGAWSSDLVQMMGRAAEAGSRQVLSPHGELTPWELDARRHTPAIHAQRRWAGLCYCLVADGELEARLLQETAWNPRVETALNPFITQQTTIDACQHTYARIYGKVLASHPRQRLDAASLAMLRAALKAGITGDRRWTDTASTPPRCDWATLLHYATLEGVADEVRRGIAVLGVAPPADAQTSDVLTGHAPQADCYLPTGYEKPISLYGQKAAAIVIRLGQRPSLRLLADLDKTLRRPDADDEAFREEADRTGTTELSARLMAVLADETGLEEGFMPLPPLRDKQTQALRQALENSLRLI